MATSIIHPTPGTTVNLTGDAAAASPVGTKFSLNQSSANFKMLRIYTGRNNLNSGGIMYFYVPSDATIIRVMAPTSLNNTDYYILQKNSNTEYEVVAASNTAGNYGVRGIFGIY